MMFVNAFNLRTYMYRSSERVHLGNFVILPRGCKFFHSEILAANGYKIVRIKTKFLFNSKLDLACS